MKTWSALCSCMLLSCGAVLAEIGALDDFNDNIMNPTNWYVNDPLLTESKFIAIGYGKWRKYTDVHTDTFCRTVLINICVIWG